MCEVCVCVSVCTQRGYTYRVDKKRDKHSQETLEEKNTNYITFKQNINDKISTNHKNHWNTLFIISCFVKVVN